MATDHWKVISEREMGNTSYNGYTDQRSCMWAKLNEKTNVRLTTPRYILICISSLVMEL